jgi:hypothetical protein
MSIILIGSGGGLKSKGMGKKIDEYDITVRFNYSGSSAVVNPNTTDIVGSKQDYWFCLETNYLILKNLAWAKKFKKIFIKGLDKSSFEQWYRRRKKTILKNYINTPAKFTLLKKATKDAVYCLYKITNNNAHKNIFIIPFNWIQRCKNIITKIFPGYPQKYKPTTGLQALLYLLLYERLGPPIPPPLPPYTPQKILDEYNPLSSQIPDNFKIKLCGFDGFKTGHFYGGKFIRGQKMSDIRSHKGANLHYGKGEQYILKHLEDKGKIQLL